MDISYLQEFIVLTETQNYLEAADKLFTTQSSLTRHIQTMEKELGIKLFDRTTRSCTLSEYGRIFLPYAKQIVELQYQYRTAIFNEQRSLQGNVRIGSIPMMVPYGITDTFVRFMKDNPSLTLDVIEADSADLTSMLKDGQCDFAFMRELPREENEFNTLHFSADNLAVIMKKTDPLAAQETVALFQLKDRPLLLLSPTTMMYKLCVSECRRSGFEPNVVMNASRANSLLKMIRSGMGLGILTKKPLQDLLGDDLIAVDIVPEIKTYINLCYCKDRKLSPASSHFLDMIKSMIITDH